MRTFVNLHAMILLSQYLDFSPIICPYTPLYQQNPPHPPTILSCLLFLQSILYQPSPLTTWKIVRFTKLLPRPPVSNFFLQFHITDNVFLFNPLSYLSTYRSRHFGLLARFLLQACSIFLHSTSKIFLVLYLYKSISKLENLS